MTGLATAGQAYKTAMVDAAAALFADQDILVTFGAPTGEDGLRRDDVVGVAGLEVEQTTGPLGTPRTRDEHMVLTVWVSVFRAGDVPDLERQASDRAFDLLSSIEHHVRQTDTTLGGTVLWCWLTSYTTTGFVDTARQVAGRTVDVEAKFTARARVTGR